MKSLVPYLAAGAGLCFVGYCIYFDRKRRSHPEFRERLRKKRLQQAKDAQKASNFPIPPINDPAAMQNFFLQQIQQGELALSLGAVDEGIQHLAVAVSICGKPSKLLQVLQQSISPSIFLRLVETLPSVQAIFVSLCILLIAVPNICHGDRDPFDMFGRDKLEPSSNEGAILKESKHITQLGTEKTDLGHYRDLHLVLSRILWHSLKLNDVQASSTYPLKLKIIASLRREDIGSLSQYCGPNKTLSDRISPDIVNSIFSHLFESVSIHDQDSQTWLFPTIPSFQLSSVMVVALVVSLFPVFIMIRKKFLGFLVLFIIFLQELRQKYKTRVAQKMATMSRFQDLSERCQNGEGWVSWLFSYWKSRPKADECAEYYEQLMTDPLLETSVYDVILDLFLRPLSNLGSMLGKSAGLFYHQLSDYVPFYMIPIMFGIIVATIVLIVRLTCLPAAVVGRHPTTQCTPKRPKKVRSKSPPLPIDNNQQNKAN